MRVEVESLVFFLLAMVPNFQFLQVEEIIRAGKKKNKKMSLFV
jgi:hypothetical protein